MISSVRTHSIDSTAHVELRSDSGTVVTNTSNRKLFVLDTNVILHDAECLFKFHEHDIAVPITVLEELDQFRKGDSDIHFQARQFLRSLDELAGNVMSDKGASLGNDLGDFRVLMNPEYPEADSALLTDTADHRILKTALATSELLTEQDVILVTKDTNLRLKAKAFGLVAQDYNSDKIRHLDDLYTGKRIFNDVPSESIRQLYEEPGVLESVSLPIVSRPIANENFILRNGSRSVLATYDETNRVFRRITRTICFGIRPRNAEQAFALQALTDPAIRLVTLCGRAGSGKTLMALAAALDCQSEFRRILLARPIVPLSNRDLGFLPGDAHAKIEPYMQPLLDNLSVLRHENQESVSLIQQMQDEQILEITPLAYIRGRSLQQTYFIVDEAQNLTPHEIKTVVTRAGEGTKIVLTGDLQQIDHPYLDSTSNGLTYAINRMKGQRLHAHITLGKGVRSELSELAGALL